MREALRLFMICDATRWSHLPLAGGWYDQSPAFIEQIIIIFGVKSKHEKREAERQKAQARAKKK